eukprot:9041123-Alexandrium_andersonii.AAC.1
MRAMMVESGPLTCSKCSSASAWARSSPRASSASWRREDPLRRWLSPSSRQRPMAPSARSGGQGGTPRDPQTEA